MGQLNNKDIYLYTYIEMLVLRVCSHVLLQLDIKCMVNLDISVLTENVEARHQSP